jgi:hypothetical protein
LNFIEKLKQIKSDYKVSNEGNISEKTFSYRILAGAIGMLLCAVCIIASSLAYFSYDERVANQKLTGANYTVKPSIVLHEGGEDIEIFKNPSTGLYCLEPGVYTVSLPAEGTAKTGYCRISIGDVDYFTDEIRITGEPEAPVYQFTLRIENGAGTDNDHNTSGVAVTSHTHVCVKITARWGIHNGDADLFSDKGYTLTSGGIIADE